MLQDTAKCPLEGKTTPIETINLVCFKWIWLHISKKQILEMNFNERFWKSIHT